MLLAINTSMTVNQLIELLLPAERYILAAEKLEVTRAQLNGYELKLRVHDELLALRSQHTEFVKWNLRHRA